MTDWHTEEIRIHNSENTDLEQLTKTHSTDLHETEQTLALKGMQKYLWICQKKNWQPVDKVTSPLKVGEHRRPRLWQL